MQFFEPQWITSFPFFFLQVAEVGLRRQGEVTSFPLFFLPSCCSLVVQVRSMKTCRALEGPSLGKPPMALALSLLPEEEGDAQRAGSF